MLQILTRILNFVEDFVKSIESWILIAWDRPPDAQAEGWCISGHLVSWNCFKFFQEIRVYVCVCDKEYDGMYLGFANWS